MGKYVAVYKCPLCNTFSRIGESVEIPYDKLPEVIASVVKNQMFAGNPYLYNAPMYIPHKCANGNAGLAQFAGLVEDKSNTTNNPLLN